MSVSLSSVLGCSITSAGISAPTYDEVRSALVSMFQTIYGADISLDNSTQDGQLIGIFAEAIDQVNSATIDVYNSFSPTYAQGAGLSSVVGINGVTRKASTYSTVDLLLSGTPGTVLTNCTATDNNNYVWAIPSGTVIPSTGAITVTATCTTTGSILASPDTITTISTPTLGWSGVTNPTAAASGNPVEADSTLRTRRAASTMLPSQTIMDGIIGGIATIQGVTIVEGYENDTTTTDANGIPPYSVAIVVEGGDAQEIATMIANKKSMGTPTVGNTTETVTDSYGNSRTINFYRPSEYPIYVSVALTALDGYVSEYGDTITSTLSEYILSLSPGDTLYLSRLYSRAILSDTAGGDTYDITSIEIGTSSTSLGTDNIVIPFNAYSVCPTSNITLAVKDS